MVWSDLTLTDWSGTFLHPLYIPLWPGVILDWLRLVKCSCISHPRPHFYSREPETLDSAGAWLPGHDLTLAPIVIRRGVVRDDIGMTRSLNTWAISGKQWAGSGNTQRQGQRDRPGVGQRQKQFGARRRYELDITPGPLPRIRWFIELLCQQKTGVKWVSFDSDQILIQMMGRASGHPALLDN